MLDERLMDRYEAGRRLWYGMVVSVPGKSGSPLAIGEGTYRNEVASGLSSLRMEGYVRDKFQSRQSPWWGNKKYVQQERRENETSSW